MHELSAALYQRSLSEPDSFWAEQAERIHWHRPFETVCDFSRPPFAKWFVRGETNLCFNALDRHLDARADQSAIRFLSTETGEDRTITYRDLHRQVNRFAAVLKSLGMTKGDRVILYLPMIPEAVVATLACARLGLIHSTVFAGFASQSLAHRIDDAGATLVVTADAGMRNGKLVPLKRLADNALSLALTPVRHQLVIQRGLDKDAPMIPGRDVDYESAAASFENVEVPCEWLESNDPSYLLYTSGTTAKPKGIQRDTGGYAVALATSMRHIFDASPGETFFSTADIGWVVGHSYTIYGPLLQGMTTVIYEGLPTRPDGAIWWNIVEQTGASVMFSSPTALRVLKKQDPQCLQRHDLSSLRSLFVAGEPLDEHTVRWISEALGHVQIVDNYWQTESGWPILTHTPGLGPIRTKPGSPGFACYGYDARVVHAVDGTPLPAGEKGVLAVGLPLPPGCLSTVWRNDQQFEQHYCGQFPGQLLYSTFDYAVQDEEGYFFILGRTDDVINVAGHRLGTREIEEALCSHSAVAEAAAVGAADELKGQVVKCFVVLKQPDQFASLDDREVLIKQLRMAVETTLGAIARPELIAIISQLPKTRSGKVLRRTILDLVEGRETGDLSTLDDATSLDSIRRAIATP